MINVSVGASAITIPGNVSFVAGSKRVYKCKFSFSPEWASLGKSISFANGSVVIPATLNADGECILPREVIENAGSLTIGAVGTQGGTALITLESDPITVTPASTGALPATSVVVDGTTYSLRTGTTGEAGYITFVLEE